MEEMNITYAWLIAGVFLMLVEAFGFPGTGLVFAGLGALTAGSALYLKLVADSAVVAQFIIFFVSSAAWAALLWKPLQKLYKTPHKSGYSNMVGDTAYVGSQGLTKSSGEVTWSGTIMKAKLADNVAVATLEAGSEVTIVSVSGATLTVKPKH